VQILNSSLLHCAAIIEFVDESAGIMCFIRPRVSNRDQEEGIPNCSLDKKDFNEGIYRVEYGSIFITILIKLVLSIVNKYRISPIFTLFFSSAN
jgi:hypothetical protein